MISFIDKNLDQNNFKVWLYTPGGDFLGELIVDRPVLTLQLEGLVSTFEFSIPENLDVVTIQNDEGVFQSVVNPRLNETLDQFQLEVWYGDLTSEGYQKQRFIIIDTPNSFADEITQFRYKAYSREYENRFIRVVDWPGVLITEYVNTTNFTNSASFDTEQIIALPRTPKDNRLVRVELVKDFVQRLVDKTVTTGGRYDFASLQPNVETLKLYKYVSDGDDVLLVVDEDYTIVTDDYTGLVSVEYIIGSKLSENDKIYIEYKYQDPLTLSLVRTTSANLLGEFDFYYYTDNAPGVSKDSIKVKIPNIPPLFTPAGVDSYDIAPHPDSRIQIKAYYEPIIFSPGDETFENITKDALTIQQVMNSILLQGDEDNNNGKWTAYYAPALDGVLRSGFNFNNTTLFNAINEVLKSFDAVAVSDTINKRFYIYQKDTPGSFEINDEVVSRYRQQTNLSIEYGKYLRGVSQTISTEEVVTVMRGIGADNLTAASATPTGYNEYEDYAYYLDGSFITNFADIQNGTTTDVLLNKTGRWMSERLTKKLLLWLKAREGVEALLYEGPLPNQNITHNLDKFGTITLNPSTAFAGYDNNGLIYIQDNITDLIAQKQADLVPLKIEKARYEALLSVMEDESNVPHLANWSGSLLLPNQSSPNTYSGISGYRDYITAKLDLVEGRISQLTNEIGTNEKDFSFINAMLQDIYVSIQKSNFAGLIRSTGLGNYNFTTEDFEELSSFRREGVYNNKFIIKPSDLYQAMKTDIEAYREPRIEMTADVIGILQATDARVEWNNVVLGGLANIIVPRLNIDRQIQIKTLTIAPDDFSTTMTFSTEKNYIGVGQKFLGRFFSNATYNIQNNLGFNEGRWLQAAVDASESVNKLNFGFTLSSDNPISSPTVVIDQNGLTTDGHTVNPIDDTVASRTSDVGQMILFSFVKINAGRIDVYSQNNAGEVTNSVVIKPTGLIQDSALSQVVMDEDGFKINKKVGETLVPQFFVNENGDIVFAGKISQTVYEELNIDPISIEASGLVIGYDADGTNPSPTLLTLTATLAEGYTTFQWQYYDGTNWANFVGATNAEFTVTHNNSAWGDSRSLLVRCVTNDNKEASVTLLKLYDGEQGQDGESGPGVVYRGVYDIDETYYYNTTRRDVVLYNGVHYLANNINKNDQTGWGTPSSSSDWDTFGAQFDSVATNILLTENATITRGLVIGSADSNNGFIRSANSDSLNTGTGFFMNNSGLLSLGNINDGRGMFWNGQELAINGDIGGSIGLIQIGTPTNGIQMNPNGFFVTKNGEQTVAIRATGDAFFKGHVEAGTGEIGGFAINDSNLISADSVNGGNVGLFSYASGSQGLQVSGRVSASPYDFRSTTYSFGKVTNTRITTGGGLYPLEINGTLVGGGTSSRSVKENIEYDSIENEIITLLNEIKPATFNYKYGLHNNSKDVGFILDDLIEIDIPIIKEALIEEPRELLVNSKNNKMYHNPSQAPDSAEHIAVMDYSVDTLSQINLLSNHYLYKYIKELEERIALLESN